jgi:hypothetical protein
MVVFAVVGGWAYATAKTTADPCGMTKQKAGNSNSNDKGNGNI